MNIEGLFQSPASQIADFYKIQTLLYQSNPSLQDYFMQLQLDPRTGGIAKPSEQPFSRRLLHKAVRGADSASRLGLRRKFKADVLVCPMPYFARKTENQFLKRILLALSQTDAKILCLMPGNASCQAELVAELEAAKRRGQVEFIDPTATSNRIEARLRARIVREHAAKAFEEAVAILEPHGLAPSPGARAGFEYIAHFVDAWERIAEDIEFDFAVTRCHWHALCSPVCRAGRQRGKPVMTFQQGVIGHTLDVPVGASKYVAFGKSSADFLSRMNRCFFQTVGMPEPKTEYIEGGCLYDRLSMLPDQFELRTLLMVDEPIAQGDFYGVESQSQALLEVAERLLASGSSIRRLIVRPHPYWNNLDFEACQRLFRKYPMQCELSHPAWSLDDDLRRSSVAIGIFSGVLTVASACGLPTVFLQTEQGYSTGDLDCFSPGQTLLPDAAYRQIAMILSDRKEYDKARALALRNVRDYYANGANVALDASFFERHLRANSTSRQREQVAL